MLCTKGRLVSAKMPEKSTGNIAEQGNSTIVITKENKKTMLNKVNRFFLLVKAFSILGLIFPSKLEEEHCGPCLRFLMNSLKR